MLVFLGLILNELFLCIAAAWASGRMVGMRARTVDSREFSFVIYRQTPEFFNHSFLLQIVLRSSQTTRLVVTTISDLAKFLVSPSAADQINHLLICRSPHSQGNRTTPSYVGFTDSERLIGDAAKNQVAMNPINTG